MVLRTRRQQSSQPLLWETTSCLDVSFYCEFIFHFLNVTRIILLLPGLSDIPNFTLVTMAYIYIYIYTHTYIYMCIYIYIYKCVCVGDSLSSVRAAHVTRKRGENVQQFRYKKVNRKSILTDLDVNDKITKSILKKLIVMRQTAIQMKQDVFKQAVLNVVTITWVTYRAVILQTPCVANSFSSSRSRVFSSLTLRSSGHYHH